MLYVSQSMGSDRRLVKMNWHEFVIKSRGVRWTTRFQNSPRIKDTNVAEHGYYVALYAMVICDVLQLDRTIEGVVIRDALRHDLHEGLCFDIPNNVKRHIKREAGVIEKKAYDEVWEGFTVRKNGERRDPASVFPNKLK